MSQHDLINHLVDNALLHLYLTVSDTSRFMPVSKRNELLVRYLKPKLKDSRYRPMKNELRSLLAIGRHPQGQLETKLLALKTVQLTAVQEMTDAKRLFDLLEILSQEHGLDSRFVGEIQSRRSGFIYLLQEHVEHGFSQAGEQILPVSLFLDEDKVNTLLTVINQTGLFLAERQPYKGEVNRGHILLHPVSQA